MKRIYLDNNATTHIAPEVMEAMMQSWQIFGNPSSIHSFGQEAKGLLLQARDTVAGYLQVQPKEILFGSSATELLNTFLRGIPGGHVVSSNLEHSAVYNTLQALEKKQLKTTFLPGSSYGAPLLQEVEAAIRPDTRLITLMAVNNETGVKTDIEAIGALASSRAIPFLVDGVCLLGKEAFTIPVGVSAMVFSGHKIHGPKGVGMAFISKNFPFTPLITGGEQESGRRGGTEDIPAIVGFGAAVRLLQTALPAVMFTMQELRSIFESELLLLGDVRINGDGPRVANTSNLAFSGVEGEELLRELDLKGVAASHGSACTSGSLEPSRPLQNMGYMKERVGSSLRFSLSRYTTSQEIEQAISIITKAVDKLRR